MTGFRNHTHESRSRRALTLAAGLLALVVLAGSAAAQPSLTGISPSRSPANNGSTVTIFGSGIGNAGDVVQFPGPTNVAVTGWGAGYVTVRVPFTWSGPVYVYSASLGQWSSNTVALNVSFNWTASKWIPASFNWYLNQNGAPGNTLGATFSAVGAGYNTWSCSSNIAISYSGTTATGPVSQTDGVNVLGWTNTGWSGSTIAVTSWRYIIATGAITQFDIAFNSQFFTWNTNGAAGDMDIQNIATHEEGHSQGLGDEYGAADTQDTMYGYSSNGEMTQRTVYYDDVEGMEYLYGSPGRPNMAAAIPAGWYNAVVPRAAADAGPGSVPQPAFLTGNATSYVSMDTHNWGAKCASPHANQQIWVDDNYAWDAWWDGVFSPGGDVAWYNLGTYVRGGRHTLESRHDTNNDIMESNEGDNVYRAQYVWSPYNIADQEALYRVVPPEQGSFSAPNCDGFQMTGNWWSSLGIIPMNSGDDYDLRLFGDYANAVTGFATPLAYSSAGGQYTDFVLVNGNAAGYAQTRQAGVVRFAAGTGGNYLAHSSNQVGSTLYPNTTYAAEVTTGAVTVGAYDIVKVHEVYLGDTSTVYRFTMNVLSGSPDLDIAIYDAHTSYFGKGNYLAASWNAGAGGSELFTYQPPSTGYYGVVVFRRSSADVGVGGTYELKVGRALANLYASTTPAGWTYPVVPRGTGDSAYGNAVLPATLPGNASTTWLNYSSDQQGPGTMPAWGTRVYLDEDYWQAWGAVGDNNGPGSYQFLNIGPVFIRGGRHSLTHYLDYDGVVPESNESDNTWRGQWIWSPLELAKEVPQVRPAPPSVGYFSEPNADGAHYAHGSGYAWVDAIAGQTAGDDYDLNLYTDYTGASSGFSVRPAASTYGGNVTDFVVGHFTTAINTYPAAVMYNPGGGGGAYAMDQSDASARQVGTGVATYTGVVMAANRLADVYEVYLNVNQTTRVLVTRTGGTSDLLANIYASTAGAYHARGDALVFGDGSAPGTSIFHINPTVAGWYPLVVFRNTGTGSDTPATYNLTIGALAPTGVGDGNQPVASTLGFRGAYPNPTNGQTNFAFSLPAQAKVSLEVFDLRGRRVITLANGDFSPGNHDLAWNGRDATGAQVSSGVYYALLRTQGRVLTQRVNVVR